MWALDLLLNPIPKIEDRKVSLDGDLSLLTSCVDVEDYHDGEPVNSEGGSHVFACAKRSLGMESWSLLKSGVFRKGGWVIAVVVDYRAVMS